MPRPNLSPFSPLLSLWRCPSCARAARPSTSSRLATRTASTSTSFPLTTRLPRLQHLPLRPRRHASTHLPPPRPRAPPTMADLQRLHARNNQTTINYGLALVIGFVALSYASVPLYRLLCSQTGFGGQPIRAPDGSLAGPDRADRLVPVTDVPRLRVAFRGSTSDVLPWSFTPQQREVRVHPGETALAFFTATNEGPDDIIGVATYSVAPGEVAPYFSKIQCFCFEEQRLNAGETVDMPVFFYIDRAFLEDANMRGIMDITLNYTFFSKSARRGGSGDAGLTMEQRPSMIRRAI